VLEAEATRRDGAGGQGDAGRDQIVVNGDVASEVPAVVVVVGAQRVGAVCMRANEVPDLVDQHAAGQGRTPTSEGDRVQVQSPAAIDGEGAEAFGGHGAHGEERVREVGRVLGGDQSCRDQQPL